MILARRNTEWLPGLINEIFSGEFLSGAAPATNIIENETSYELQFAVPGMKKEEMKISLNEKYLTVARSEPADGKKDDSKYLRREFGHAEFSQTFTLPEDADKTAISAKVENGILNVVIPKLSPEALQPAMKYIEIE